MKNGGGGNYGHLETIHTKKNLTEETLRIEFNELPVYWLLSVDRCVNRSWLKRGRGQAFRSEGGTTGRKPVFLPSFSRVGLLRAHAKTVMPVKALFFRFLCSHSSRTRKEARQREREREMEDGAERGEKRRGQ